MSTFHGLEMARQALSAQQSALYTTGHNISNANTEDYSRQRVNFETMSPYPSASRNRPEMPGQMGTGVKTGSVERIRNQFLDYQFRAENSKSGFWTSKSEALSRLERLMNEPSETGLSKTMDQFWQSLQDLSVNPGSSGERSVVAQRGLALAETFNYTADSLESIRSDLKNEIDITVDSANSLLSQINGINEQIKEIEPHGYLANDLYDERDRLIDELSGIVNIKVSYTKSGNGALDIADGLATIELADNNGDASTKLLDGDSGEIQKLSVAYSDEENERQAVAGIVIGDNDSKPIADFQSAGSLKGTIEAYGYTSDEGVKGIYTDMLNDMDQMAEAFANAFNEVHKDADGNSIEFFEFDAEAGVAASITVNQSIIDNPGLIIASGDGSAGNGDNASALAAVFDQPLDDLDGVSVKKFYESRIGEMGVMAQEANRMADNTEILRSQVENQRLSVSAVSLDEEMSNMIKFQHAYNAAARSMTTIDEMLDRIINSMGLVGR